MVTDKFFFKRGYERGSLTIRASGIDGPAMKVVQKWERVGDSIEIWKRPGYSVSITGAIPAAREHVPAEYLLVKVEQKEPPLQPGSLKPYATVLKAVQPGRSWKFEMRKLRTEAMKYLR